MYSSTQSVDEKTFVMEIPKTLKSSVTSQSYIKCKNKNEKNIYLGIFNVSYILSHPHALDQFLHFSKILKKYCTKILLVPQLDSMFNEK